MRIGFYAHYLDKYPTSAPSIYQRKIIKSLSKNFKDIEIILIHHKKNNDLDIYKEYEEAIVTKLPYLGEREINSLNLDIIHFNAIPWSWRILVNKIKCKKIVTVHGDIWWVEPRLGYNKVTETIRRLIEPRTVKYFDMIIAVSHSIKNTLINYLNCPEEKINVIYEGVDYSIFCVRPPQEVEIVKMKYKIDKPYILHVSNYSKIKNPDILFKSFKLVKDNENEIKLVIVGKGWQERYRDKLNKYGLKKDDIKFLGWINQKDLSALYSGASLLFSPSYHESFGLPILEAMACGCPVVASNKYAIPEVASDAAILHDPDDYKSFAKSIVSLLTDKNMREKLIRKGLKQSKNFSWEKTAFEIFMTYLKVLKNG